MESCFWSYLVIGGELGNGTYIDLPLVSSAMSPPIIDFDRERRFLYDCFL